VFCFALSLSFDSINYTRPGTFHTRLLDILTDLMLHDPDIDIKTKTKTHTFRTKTHSHKTKTHGLKSKTKTNGLETKTHGLKTGSQDQDQDLIEVEIPSY